MTKHDILHKLSRVNSRLVTAYKCSVDLCALSSSGLAVDIKSEVEAAMYDINHIGDEIGKDLSKV